MSTIASIVTAMHAHARKCKESLDECVVCRANVAAMAEIPAPVLSGLLEDVKRGPLRVPILEMVADKVFGHPVQSRHAQNALRRIGARFTNKGQVYLPRT